MLIKPLTQEARDECGECPIFTLTVDGVDEMCIDLADEICRQVEAHALRR